MATLTLLRRKQELWQCSQAHCSQCLALSSREAGFPPMAGEQDRVSSGGGLKEEGREGDFLFNACCFLCRTQFSSIGKDGKFWFLAPLLEQWIPSSREGRLAVAVGSGWRELPGWGVARQREDVHSGELRAWAQSPVPMCSQPDFLGPPECQGAPVLACSLACSLGWQEFTKLGG